MKKLEVKKMEDTYGGIEYCDEFNRYRYILAMSLFGWAIGATLIAGCMAQGPKMYN